MDCKKEDTWYCLGCGIDMGKQNPRQYCRKIYCPYLEDLYEDQQYSKKSKTEDKLPNIKLEPKAKKLRPSTPTKEIDPIENLKLPSLDK